MAAFRQASEINRSPSLIAAFDPKENSPSAYIPNLSFRPSSAAQGWATFSLASASIATSVGTA